MWNNFEILWKVILKILIVEFKLKLLLKFLLAEFKMKLLWKFILKFTLNLGLIMNLKLFDEFFK